MLKITDVIDADTAAADRRGIRPHGQARRRSPTSRKACSTRPDDGRARCSRARRSSPSWATSTTARPRCSTRSARPTSSRGEAGGITQHIGAYQVDDADRRARSPSSTRPGHAAFTAMRARGAKVTDIVVLVVAADDGVMPQTIEAINHAKAAERADHRGDQQDRQARRQSASACAPSCCSTRCMVEIDGRRDARRRGLGHQEDRTSTSCSRRSSLQAEVLDLKANPDRPAEGIVIEAKLDRGRGPVATVLVQRGTLQHRRHRRRRPRMGPRPRPGQRSRRAGRRRPARRCRSRFSASAARRRPATASRSSRTRPAPARSPSTASARRATQAAARGPAPRGSLDQMMSQLKSAGRKEFPLVIKGDVQGSVEAIVGALEKLGTDEVARAHHPCRRRRHHRDPTSRWPRPRTPSIIGFNVRANKQARDAAERDGIEIRYYNIIYDLVDDVKAAMSGLLAPTLRENVPRQAAHPARSSTITKVGKVAGCRVTDGTVERGAQRAPDPRQRRHPRRQALDAQALQGRGQGSRRPARNAAWPSRTTRTCAPATSSSASASRKSRARSERRVMSGRSCAVRIRTWLGILPRSRRPPVQSGRRCMTSRIRMPDPPGVVDRHARRAGKCATGKPAPRSASCASANSIRHALDRDPGARRHARARLGARVRDRSRRCA